jgi:hypothetical protein
LAPISKRVSKILSLNNNIPNERKALVKLASDYIYALNDAIDVDEDWRTKLQMIRTVLIERTGV